MRNREQFLNAVREFAEPLGWTARSFEREEELIAFVELTNDPAFERVAWVYSASKEIVRCLLMVRDEVPAERREAAIELCARINDGLFFGCLEYGFKERTLTFRDSFPMSAGTVAALLPECSARILGLGAHFSPAVRATLAGIAPERAMAACGE